MRISTYWLFIVILLASDLARAEVFYWSDPDGTVNFSDAAPPGKSAKRLKGYDQCPLRREIVELDASDRVNLGLWLYLGAPRIPDVSHDRRRDQEERWLKRQGEYDSDVRASRMMRLKNEIVRETRRCGAGNEQACDCSRSLFHDPPRGFAPEGYRSPGGDPIPAWSTQSTERGLER